MISAILLKLQAINTVTAKQTTTHIYILYGYNVKYFVVIILFSQIANFTQLATNLFLPLLFFFFFENPRPSFKTLPFGLAAAILLATRLQSLALGLATISNSRFKAELTANTSTGGGIFKILQNG